VEIDFNNLHHAYLVVGQREEAEKALHASFEARGFLLKGSPDFFLWRGDLFGIEEARDLSEKAVRSSFTGRKVFFIAPGRITHEAQNALLKTFEEPVQETNFFLVARDEASVLPTLLSRMRVINLESRAGEGSDAEKFLSASLKARLDLARRMAEQEESLPDFLDRLLKVLHSRKASLRSLERVHAVRIVSETRGAAARLILEHLALVL